MFRPYDKPNHNLATKKIGNHNDKRNHSLESRHKSGRG